MPDGIGLFQVVAFASEADKCGNETWNIYVPEPVPRRARSGTRGANRRRP